MLQLMSTKIPHGFIFTEVDNLIHSLIVSVEDIHQIRSPCPLSSQRKEGGVSISIGGLSNMATLILNIVTHNYY